MTPHIRPIVTAAILLLLSASLALGASVSVTSQGNGVYTVQASDMDGVSGFDLVLNYDATVLASPSISQGALVSGAMFAANPNYSKTSIKIAAVSTKSFSGSGPIATITFGTHSGTGSVTVASFSPINSSGATVSGSITTGDTTSSDTTGTTSNETTSSNTNRGSNGTSGTTTTNTTTTGNSGPTYLGTVTMPSDSQSQHETKTPPSPAPEGSAKPAEAPTPSATEAAPTIETPAVNETAAAKTKKAETIATASNTAVLERFRAYKGEKTPAILIALFKEQISASFRQEPFVALSDGTTTVTIAADLSAESGGSPNFALNGAKLVSLRKSDTSPTWYIEALPTKGVLSASLMVLSENHVTEYPLTIAPAIKNAASTEVEFATFLKDAAKTPAQHDLNGDGRYDGIDDYIYAANYLARQMKAQTIAK
ncbi:cohesin domain-containing protein [Geobacter sp. AOG2]|uniref:cohesin domain-containing protein n=1 Tax=Geobacter sp. AOG2 TaxID=1566347 RepID=UPI001CC5A4DA|nr:cohesin domain-containing protein [Geobacter sp. AOG2]GFE60415.1 hypothetical protein AOG2_10030 [Geobacter sp. AOG2]